MQSRYYNPEWGRFLNADSVMSGTGGDVLGYNMFAYCFNNPVNMSDSSGNWPQWAKKVVAAVAVVAVVAAVAAVTVATAGAGTAIAAVAVGAAKGAAIGFVVGAASGAAMGYATTGTLDGLLNGMADGAFSGSISGAVTGGVNGGASYTAKPTTSTMPSGSVGNNNGYTPPQGGGGVTDIVQVGDTTVTFGHGGRHLSGSTLTTSQVNNAIANDVVSRNLAVRQFLPNGSITLNGANIAYTAMKLSEFLINVGTYHIFP